MKYRYLKVTSGDLVWGTNELKKTDLLSVKRGLYEAIIDLQNMTSYDAENNEWKEIDGDQ